MAGFARSRRLQQAAHPKPPVRRRLLRRVRRGRQADDGVAGAGRDDAARPGDASAAGVRRRVAGSRPRRADAGDLLAALVGSGGPTRHTPEAAQACASVLIADAGARHVAGFRSGRGIGNRSRPRCPSRRPSPARRRCREHRRYRSHAARTDDATRADHRAECPSCRPSRRRRPSTRRRRCPARRRCRPHLPLPTTPPVPTTPPLPLFSPSRGCRRGHRSTCRPSQEYRPDRRHQSRCCRRGPPLRCCRPWPGCRRCRASHPCPCWRPRRSCRRP